MNFNRPIILVITCFVAVPGYCVGDLTPSPDLNALLAQGQYDKLEAEANARRALISRRHFDDELSELYDELGQADGGGEAGWPSKKIALEKWQTSRPKSVVPLIALGDFYIKWAWHSRGTGVASSVTAEGWQNLKARGDMANGVLQKVRSMQAKMPPRMQDPQVYYELMKVALAEQWNVQQVDECFNEGIKVQPYYYSLYEAKAHYLLPRWFGSPTDNAKFADAMAASQKSDDDADVVYATIGSYVATVEGFGVFDSTPLLWPRIKRGLSVISETADSESGRQLAANKLAMISLLAHDYVTADSSLSVLISHKWLLPGFWGNDQGKIMALQTAIRAQIQEVASNPKDQSNH
jgi:hypothetical protein